jgi:hypothetical protein
MDYVDWVEKVLQGMAEAWRVGDEYNKNMIGVSFHDVGAVMGFEAADMETYEPEKPAMAVLAALNELEALALLEEQGVAGAYYKFTQRGREVLQVGMSALWEPMVQQYIESEQLEVLTKLVEMCQEDYDTYVALRERLITDIGAALGPEWEAELGSRVYHVIEQIAGFPPLADLGGALGSTSAKPTYRGIVRVTRQADTEGQATIRELLGDWEGVNVDFKRELNLTKPSEKAEFVKDILALVTTKFTGRRYLIIGFDPKTQQFFQSVDQSITQDRLEDILVAYANPVPIIKFERVTWQGGVVGLIEAKRQPHKLPYKVKVNMTHKIRAGDVFVRHGSRIVKLEPIDDEYQDLVAEGKRARLT